jgi:hypothetical protein
MAGCPHDPFAHTYSSRKPKASDLTGTWVIDHRLTTYTPVAANAAQSSLNLSESGVFTWTGCPAMDGFDSMRVGSGEWAIEPHQEWWTLHLSWTESSFSEELMIRGDGPPYLLHRSVGDADEGQAVVLSKPSGP